MLEFIAAVVGWFASLRSTEAGVDLPSTWTCKASRADWLALLARPRVRLVLTAVRPEALAAMQAPAQALGQAPQALEQAPLGSPLALAPLAPLALVRAPRQHFPPFLF